MKKLFLTAFKVVIFGSLGFAQFDFSSDNHHPIFFPEKTVSTVDGLIDSLTLDSIFANHVMSHSIPGLATLAVKENQVIWNKNYGYRNLELQLPVNDSTTFRLASVSKTIIATAVMQLWENGMLDLEANINNYLPLGFTVTNPFNPNDAITAKMLLTHTSTIRDNTGLYSSLIICGDSPIPLDTILVNYLTPGGIYYNQNNYYNLIPGQQYNYSNIGACLLAYLVEHISGESFADYCRDSIFIPLSMNSTSWFLEGMDTTNMAVPYLNSTWICHQGSPFYPAGFLRANKLELLNFLSAYINDGMFNNYRLLDSTTISYMLSDQLGYPVSGVIVQGLIWLAMLPVNESVWGHNGASNGVETYIGLNPLENYGVIWLQNSEYSIQNLIEMMRALTQYAHQYGSIYATESSVEKSFANPNTDSVLFLTKFSNIFNLQFTPYLIFANTDSTELDSLIIYDDGLHGDSLANDGIYGGYIPPRPTEDFYYLSVSTIETVSSKYFKKYDVCRFTTVGPVTLDDIFVSQAQDSIYFYMKLLLKNHSTDSTITNAAVRIICDNPWVTSIEPDIMQLPDLPPESTISPPDSFKVGVDPSIFQYYFDFKSDVMSNGWVYWTDSARTYVTGLESKSKLPVEYSLEQNYPNPFNPATIISYSIAELGNVKLTLYNLLGEEVRTLINEEQISGNYSIKFDATNLPSGIYFYQIKAASFIDTKKMILLK